MKKTIRMTDDGGHFWLDGKLYKVKRLFSGTREEQLKGVHRATYIEVDPTEYDARVESLAKRIASFPQVDLMDVLKDALYDMPLDSITKVESKLDKEESKARDKSTEPRVETKRGERGTCVELRIGGRYGMQLRI